MIFLKSHKHFGIIIPPHVRRKFIILENSHNNYFDTYVKNSLCDGRA